MNHCLIKPQTILAPGVTVEFRCTATRSVVAIQAGENRPTLFIKFSPAGDLISVTFASAGTEVDTGNGSR